MAKGTGLGDRALSFDQLNRLASLTTELGVLDSDRPWQSMGILSGASGKAAAILNPEQLELFDLVIDARQAYLLKALDRRKAR